MGQERIGGGVLRFETLEGGYNVLRKMWVTCEDLRRRGPGSGGKEGDLAEQTPLRQSRRLGPLGERQKPGLVDILS